MTALYARVSVFQQHNTHLFLDRRNDGRNDLNAVSFIYICDGVISYSHDTYLVPLRYVPLNTNSPE